MSDPSLLARAEGLERELADTEARLADPEVIADQQRYVEMSKHYRALQPVVERAAALRSAVDDLAAAEELFAASSGDERDAWRDEANAAKATIERLEQELRVLLLPRDPNDDRNVIVELRGAEGGEEANLFARDLLEMYRAFAARQGWSVEVLSSQPSDLGGLSEAVLRVAGDGVWTRMKFEAGPHRVQRVPVTEAQGRIHTSAATVAIMPELAEVEQVDINPSDLRIDTYRASGAGGQHINKTDSAVRITHNPSGIVVQCQNDRSQHRNRAEAMAMLKSRLYEAEIRKRQTEQQKLEDAKTDIGWGHQIRSYVLDQSRIKDLRTNVEVGNTQSVLDGDLDQFIEASLKQGV